MMLGSKNILTPMIHGLLRISCFHNPKNIRNPPCPDYFLMFYGAQSYAFSCKHKTHNLLILISVNYTRRYERIKENRSTKRNIFLPLNTSGTIPACKLPYFIHRHHIEIPFNGMLQTGSCHCKLNRCLRIIPIQTCTD